MITIVLFLAIGLLTIFGVLGQGNVDVVANLSAGNHGFVGGISGFVGVLLVPDSLFKELSF